jgi:hypothetical protein
MCDSTISLPTHDPPYLDHRLYTSLSITTTTIPSPSFLRRPHILHRTLPIPRLLFQPPDLSNQLLDPRTRASRFGFLSLPDIPEHAHHEIGHGGLAALLVVVHDNILLEAAGDAPVDVGEDDAVEGERAWGFRVGVVGLFGNGRGAEFVVDGYLVRVDEGLERWG